MPEDKLSPQDIIVAELDKDKELRDVVIKAFLKPVNNDPLDLAQRRNAIQMPYYKHVFGMEMKLVFDTMAADEMKRDFIYRYSAYPKLKPSSLYLKINQSKLYLLDKLDTADYHYRRLAAIIDIDRTRSKSGIMLCWNRDLIEGGTAPLPEPVNDDESVKEYIEAIDKFLQDETEPILHLKGIALSGHEMELIQSSLADLTNIAPVVTEREIKLVKTDWKKEK